jgi:RND family efflux transporter MFP subunit
MSSEGSSNLGSRLAVSLVLVLVFVAMGVGIMFLFVKMKKKATRVPGAPPRTAVKVIEAKRAPYREILSGYGRARALREAQIAAEVGGVVRWVSRSLEAGMAVDKDEELVRLDARDYERALESAEARLAQAGTSVPRLKTDQASIARRLALTREDLLASKRELERIRGLAEGGVVTRSELDRQRISTSLTEKQVLILEAQESSITQELARAQSEIEAATAAKKRASLDLERTVIKSPYSGRIINRLARVGARVAPGAALFEIVDLSRVEVPVALGASQFGEVVAGAAASIRLTEGGEVVWEGKVVRVSAAVRSQDRTFLVYLVIDGSAEENPVPPGAFVIAEVEGRLHESVIPVPRAAFVADRLYVAVRAENGEALIDERTPEIERLLPERALVKGGLKDGELVVVTNLEQIADGSRVQLVESAAEGER